MTRDIPLCIVDSMEYKLWVPPEYNRKQDDRASYITALESVIKEYGIGTAEIDLAREDIGWQKLGGTANVEVSATDRIATVRRARAYYARDPLSKQAVRIWTNYALGNGISWKASEDTTNDALRGFWAAKANRPLFSSQGQRKSSDKLLVDGEIFFVLFPGVDSVAVRRIDPLEITEIITDPDDIETKLFYKREYYDAQNRFHTNYYADWLNEKPSDEVPDAAGKMVSANADGLIYHLAVNTIGQRGNSLLMAAMDWSKAHRKFLEARASITQALSKFAWKAKVKGGSAAVTAMRNSLRSSLAAGSDTETNPAPTPGSTILENEGFDLTPIKVETGAASAQTDANMLLQLFGAAVGIFPHYFGAGEAFRLATAAAMERPMRVQFESYQQLWGDTYSDFFDYFMEMRNVPADKRFVDIDFPPTVDKDVAAVNKVIVDMVTAMPEMSVDEVKKLLLTNLGINNPDEVLQHIKPMEAAAIQLTKALVKMREEAFNNNGKH